MSEMSVSSRAQIAMMRLLAKLNLVATKSTAEDYKVADRCPIDFLANSEQLDESAAITAVAKHLNIPQVCFDRSSFAVAVGLLEDPRILNVPLSRWKGLRAAPYTLSGDRLNVVFANPMDHEARASLEFELGFKVSVSIASEAQILSLLSKSFNIFEGQDLKDLIESTTVKSDLQLSTSNRFESNVFSGDLSAAPVVRLVNNLLSEAVDAGASDIHFAPAAEVLQVRVRVDGIMRDLSVVPGALQSAVISRIKLLCGMDITERRKPQDGRLRIKTGFGVKDLRISSLPTAYGESLVARVLSSDFSRLTFEALEMPPAIEYNFCEALRSSSRVILVTGPTGSGKTSTLYTGLTSLCDGKRHIITVEDPIEYRLQGINQVQVNAKVGMGFAESLRSILRQDPDIVMVGEIRDRDTATIAMQAAQTGHLVLSTLHTNGAAAAIVRLQDLDIPSYLIAASLGGILAQRLLRKLCSCSQSLTEEQINQLAILGFSEDEVLRMRSPVGCDQCGGSGYSGRRGIYSYLDLNDKVREAIREQNGEREIERCARAHGYRTLAENARDLLFTGATSLDEVERIIGPLGKALQESNSLDQVAGAEPVSSTHTASGGLTRRHVLLVEDDPNMRAVLSILLERELYDVTEAGNGQEGLEKVYERMPDLILCDLMMPKVSGLDLLRRLRADPRTAKIPVLILTAADSEENEIDIISSGADDFLSKTADSKVMLARIDRLLR